MANRLQPEVTQPQEATQQQEEKATSLDELVKISGLPKGVVERLDRDVCLHLYVGKKVDSRFNLELKIPSILIVAVLFMLFHYLLPLLS